MNMDRKNTADHHQMWSRLRPSRGLFARTSPEAVRVQQQQQQQGAEISAVWAPSWATSYMLSVCDDTKNTSPLQPISVDAPVAPQWNYQPQQQQGVCERDGRAEAAGHYSTGLLDFHRQGWKGKELRASDVENGKIVELARDHGPAEPKPSRSPLLDTASVRDRARAAPAVECSPRWKSSWPWAGSSYEPLSSSSSFGAAPAALSPLVSSAADPLVQGLLQPSSRRGWNWSPCPRELWSPRRGLDLRPYRFNSSPCLESKLDEEMAVFESQLTRTLSGYLSNRTNRTPPVTRPLLSPEKSPHAEETSAPVVADAASCGEKNPSGVSSVLKRKRADLADGDVQGESRWTQSLKLLVCKGLTLSDAGELGRIVLPKKDAESPSFLQIDTKEGTVLEMEDYKTSKRWYFRFKYWLNNKSRTYVLENTGDFIKYHCLKERDIFSIFEDGCKKFVVRGLKLESGDPVLELSKGPMVESFSSQAPPPSTTEDESCCNVISACS